MRGWVLVVLLAGAAWGQGVVVKPPEVETGAKPQLVAQVGHTEAVRALALSPDEQLLASGGADSRILVWDLRLQKVRQILEAGVKVEALAFSPNGRWLVSPGPDQQLVLWDLQRGVPERSWRWPDSRATALAFSPDGRTLATGGGATDRVALWDVPDGRLQQTVSIGSPAVALAFSPDGRRLAVAARTLKLLETANWQLLPPFDPAEEAEFPQCAGFSPDGRWLVSGHARTSGPDEALSGCRVHLWDVASGRHLASHRAHSAMVCGVGVLGAGQSLVSTGSDGTLVVWDVKGNKVAQGGRFGGESLGPLLVLPGAHELVLGSNQGWLWRWDLDREAPVGYLGGQASATEGLRYAPSGGWLAATMGSQVHLWDTTTGRLLRCLGTGAERRWFQPALGGHGQVLALSPDSELILSTGTDVPPALWRASDGSLVRTLDGPTGGIHAVAFSPDGQACAAAGMGQTVWVWEVATGTLERTLTDAQDVLWALSFSRDGSLLAAGGWSGVLFVWDTSNGRLCSRLKTPLGQVQALCFAPHERSLIAAVAFSSLGLLDALTGKVTRGLWQHTDLIVDVTFSRDGRLVAAAAQDGRVAWWDLAKGPGHQFVDRAGWTAAVSFDPTGRFLATSGADGTVRLYRLQPFRHCGTLVALRYGGAWLAACPEGYYDASCGADGAVTWRLGSWLYPFDQFSDKFNRPDLVRRALAGEDISDASPLDATQLPPNLGFISPQYGAEVSGDQVDVELQAAGKYPIRRLDLTVNGTPLPAQLARQLEVEQPDQTTRTFKLTVPLPPDEPRVRLRAVAYDTESLKSRVEEVTLFRPGVKAGVGALHVLAMGINRYPKLAEQYQLRYAAPDAQSIVEALGKLGGGKPYTEVQTKLLLDDQATVTNLKFALRDLKDTATENDVAVIFVSGHGVADPQGNFYFPTYEVDLHDLPGTALSWQDFVGALREVRAKRVLVLADTCHSGAVVGQGQSADELLAKRLNKEAHRLVFAASGRDEVSIGREEWGHGAFTKGLLEALEGRADVDQNGKITFQELKDYVPGRVSDLTENRQHPQLPFLDSFEPDAVFARLR